MLQEEEVRDIRLTGGKTSKYKDKLGVFIMQGEQTPQREREAKQDLPLPGEITSLLERFQHLFEEPRWLPLHKEHMITEYLWRRGVKGINVRP